MTWDEDERGRFSPKITLLPVLFSFNADLNFKNLSLGCFFLSQFFFLLFLISHPFPTDHSNSSFLLFISIIVILIFQFYSCFWNFNFKSYDPINFRYVNWLFNFYSRFCLQYRNFLFSFSALFCFLLTLS